MGVNMGITSWHLPFWCALCPLAYRGLRAVASLAARALAARALAARALARPVPASEGDYYSPAVSGPRQCVVGSFLALRGVPDGILQKV